jgi:hypothetical protein
VRPSYLAIFTSLTHTFTVQKQGHGASSRNVDESVDLFRRIATGVGTLCVECVHAHSNVSFGFFLNTCLNSVVLKSNTAVNLKHHLSLSF